MKKLLVPSLVCLSINLFGQVSFEAVTDAQSVLQNSSFQLSFRLNNAQGSNFNAPDFSPFQILAGPARSMQTNIINGAMSSSIGYVYTLACSQVGSFTIKPANILVNGKVMFSKPITIKVVKASSKSSNGAEIMVIASLDKSEAFVGEQLCLSYKLYTQVNIDNMEMGKHPNLDAFQDQAVNMLNNPTLREIYNGKEYTTKILSKTILFPVKSGRIQIEPTIYRFVKGSRDPFGFGMSSMFQSEVENVASNSLEILIKELPKPIPENFSGAVGNMSIQYNPVSSSYSLNDAIHLGLQLHGDANFNTMNPNFIKLDSSFEITDSKSGDIIKVTDEPRLTNTRKFDFLLLPKKSGDFVLTPGFVYFNTESKKYIQLQDSFRLHISPVQSAIKNDAQDAVLEGIVENPTLISGQNTLFSDPKIWVLGFLPIAFILIGLLRTYNLKNKLKDENQHENRTINLSILNMEVLEYKLLEKIQSAFNPDMRCKTLNEAKMYLIQFKKEDPRFQNYLNQIQQLEAVKYSGNQDAAKLQELQAAIERLN